uniref:C2 domain-containing protein n=1 Tax=Plectus sambesii TaxID=2011161 RepID=A0A914WA19_9BILA
MVEVGEEVAWIAIVALCILILLLLLLVCCYFMKKKRRPLISDVECAPSRVPRLVVTESKTTTDIYTPPPLQKSLLKQTNINYGTTDINDMPTRLERALEAPFVDVMIDADSEEPYPKKDDDAQSSSSSEVGSIIAADNGVHMNATDPPSRRATPPCKGRTMSLLTPDLYGSVRAPHSVNAEGEGEEEEDDGATAIGSSQPKRRSPRPILSTNEPIIYGEHEVQLDVLHLTSLDEIVVTVKQGRKFDPSQTYAMLITVENGATQKSRTLETAHIGGLEQPRWNEQIVFGGIKESCLEDVTITVAVIRKDANDLWEDEGHIVLSEISPHSSGRIHFMQMMTKNGSAAPKWHRVAINLF